MSKNIEKQKDRFYKRYPIDIDKEHDTKIGEFFLAKLEKDKDKISEGDYQEQKKQILELSKKTKEILNLDSICQELEKKETEEYKDALLPYKNIVDSTAQLCQELKLNDSMSIFVVFDYLLWNGYFSKSKNYFYTKSGRKNIFNHYGLDIINGKGVCLNKAKMFEELLAVLNYESYLISNRVNKKMTVDYKPNIKRKIKKEGQIPMEILTFVLNPITKWVGNHACTLVKKDNVYYVYDPTNLCVFKLDDFLEAHIIGGTGSIDIKPYNIKALYGLDNQRIV